MRIIEPKTKDLFFHEIKEGTTFRRGEEVFVKIEEENNCNVFSLTNNKLDYYNDHDIIDEINVVIVYGKIPSKKVQFEKLKNGETFKVDLDCYLMKTGDRNACCLNNGEMAFFGGLELVDKVDLVASEI